MTTVQVGEGFTVDDEPEPDSLYCVFCGSHDFSGQYTAVTIPGGPEGRSRLPLPTCFACHANRTHQELCEQFARALTRPRREFAVSVALARLCARCGERVFADAGGAIGHLDGDPHALSLPKVCSHCSRGSQ